MGADRSSTVVVRGGGDLATGVVWRLNRAGFRVVITELAEPLTVRRTVAVSSAVADGCTTVEGMTARRVESVAETTTAFANDEVPVLVSPELPAIEADVIVDARLAKRKLDTSIEQAPLVIALGPGFVAGADCHAVIETMRGPRLGRVLWSGSAEPNTGTPGTVGGRGRERVLRAPADGPVIWKVSIGDRVSEGTVLGEVASLQLVAPFDGVVRGLIRPGTVVSEGLKIGDVDPRSDVNCHEISDKALAVGGGVLEAVFTVPDRRP